MQLNKMVDRGIDKLQNMVSNGLWLQQENSLPDIKVIPQTEQDQVISRRTHIFFGKNSDSQHPITTQSSDKEILLLLFQKLISSHLLDMD